MQQLPGRPLLYQYIVLFLCFVGFYWAALLKKKFPQKTLILAFEVNSAASLNCTFLRMLAPTVLGNDDVIWIALLQLFNELTFVGMNTLAGEFFKSGKKPGPNLYMKFHEKMLIYICYIFTRL